MSENHLLGEELPAVWTNRFQVNATEIAVRIAFAEIVPSGSPVPHPLAVVSMSPSDAAELASLLQKVSRDLQELLAQERKKAN